MCFTSKYIIKYLVYLENVTNKHFPLFPFPTNNSWEVTNMVSVVTWQCLLNDYIYDENRKKYMLFHICLDIFNFQTHGYLIQHPFSSVCWDLYGHWVWHHKGVLTNALAGMAQWV